MESHESLSENDFSFLTEHRFSEFVTEWKDADEDEDLSRTYPPTATPALNICYHSTKEIQFNHDLFYIEFNIESGGVYNDLSIGVTNDLGEIEYNVNNGEITKKGVKKALGPVCGSYDVIGVGVSYFGYVFFTYHGLPIFPVINVE
jgi:hypothetical protein